MSYYAFANKFKPSEDFELVSGKSSEVGAENAKDLDPADTPVASPKRAKLQHDDPNSPPEEGEEEAQPEDAKDSHPFDTPVASPKPATLQQDDAKVVGSPTEEGKEPSKPEDADEEGALPDEEDKDKDVVKVEATRATAAKAIRATPPIPVATRKVSSPVIERFVRKLYWSHYSLPDSYLLDGMPVSTWKMTHEIGLLSSSGKPVDAADLLTAEQDEIITDLARMMLTSAHAGVVPLVSFRGPDVLLACDTETFLVDSYERLRATSTLGPYQIIVRAKGLPFPPHFWLLRGLRPRTGFCDISAELQSFTTRHKRMFGEAQVVYGSFYRIPSLGSEAVFSGNILFVTDARTADRDPFYLPSCEETEPTRIDRPELPL